MVLLPLQASMFGQPFAVLLLLAGVGLMVAEALAPGAHFIVVGIALFIAGLIGTVAGPFSPLILSLIVLLAGIGTFIGYRELNLYGDGQTDQTSDSTALRGEFGRVTETVTPRGGEVKLDNGGFNPYYSAKSEHETIEEGTEVMVVDPGGGNVVTVAPTEQTTDPIDRELAQDRDATSSASEPEATTELERDPETES